MAAPDVLLDTSAAVAFVVADHEAHGATWDALERRVLGLAGHAWFETFSVLTRLPPPNRRSAAVVGRVIAANFPESRFLGARDAASLARRLSELGVSGGSVYDALVAASARAHDVGLATRDRRAADTYRSVGAEVELIG